MIAKIAPSLAALLLFFTAGMGLQACLPVRLERSWTARAGLGFLLGVAWVGVVSWLVAMVAEIAIGGSLFAAVASAPVIAGAALWVRRRRAERRAAAMCDSLGTGAGWALRIVGLALVLVTIGLLAAASADPVSDFDGRMTWGTQAQYLLASRSVEPEALVEPRAYIIHPRYPILMPLAQAAVVALSTDSFRGYAVRPLYALFLIALASAVTPALRRAGGRLGAAAALALVFLSPVVAWRPEGGAAGSYSDLPLASFLGAGLCLLADSRTRRHPSRVLAAGLLLAAAAATKNEGLLLAPVVLLASWWTSRTRNAMSRRTWRRRLLGALALVGAGVTLVLTWQSHIPNRNDEAYFETASLARLTRGLSLRLPSALASMAGQTWSWTDWGALFWVLPALGILGWRDGRCRTRLPRAALYVLSTQIVIAVAAYSMVHNRHTVEVTWYRFLIQMLVPLALAVAASMAGVRRIALPPTS